MNTKIQTSAKPFLTHQGGASSLLQLRFPLTLWVLLLAIGAHGAVTIHDAVKAGDAEAVRAILQTNAAAALLTNTFGETALHLGAGAASPAVVEALLAANAPVPASSGAGCRGRRND